MVRRHAVVLTLALAAPLAACSEGADIVSDRSDLGTAVAVWSDPWVAPSSATVAGPALGSNGQVDRAVARRTTPYVVDVATATRSELRAARSAGWAPTSSTCGDTVQVALVAPTGDAVAQLVVTPDEAGAGAALQVAVRHHLDSSWETPEPVERTCLDSESPPFEPPPLASAPLGDPDATNDADAGWDDDSADEALIEAAGADPALAELGLRVVAPTVEDGTNRRQAPAAEVVTDAATLGDLSAQLPGWRLTFAACGGGGATLATYVHDLGPGPAVLAARVEADGTTLRLTLPMTEGPDPSRVLELAGLEDSACLDDTSQLPRNALGTPAVLPSDLTPIAD